MSRSDRAKDKNTGARNVKLIVVLSMFVGICLAFAAGFFIRGEESMLETLGFTSLLEKPEEAQSLDSRNASNSLAARMAEVEDILVSDSLDVYDVNQLTPSIFDTLTKSNADGYLRYYDQDRYAKYVKESTKKYAGIGVLFSEYNGEAYVVDVFPGSVAEIADVQAGDFVQAINGDTSQKWSYTEAVNAVSQDEGESVVITWRRPVTLDASGGETFTTTLECHEYKDPNVVGELHNAVGYIKLTQITQNSASLVKAEIEKLSSQGAASFVLDIRDNPGGYLTQAVDIASLFIKSGVIVGIETKDSPSSTKSATGAIATDKPVVLLINGNTAAAAEVIAAALKDNERATLVGENTLGKGSVQVVKALSFGGALRYTAAYYKSPLGHDIDKTGVSPSTVVIIGNDGGIDDQKKLALDTAQSMVRG